MAVEVSNRLARVLSMTQINNCRELLSYYNWKRYEAKETELAIFEYPLYTDARIIDQATDGFGPCQFLNTVPFRDEPGLVEQFLILRYNWYVSEKTQYPIETNDEVYHGGNCIDEIAALVSLCLGVRMKAGGLSRKFYPLHKDRDPLGQPCCHGFERKPVLNLDNKNLILPDIVKPANLEQLEPLKNLTKLSREQCIALIRSARLYQDALWICESEPALAWLMFVSAIETSANQWSSEQDTPIERLKSSKPKLEKILLEKGDEQLLEDVANEISHTLGATNKFIKFCLQFLPDSPLSRPSSELYQISFSKTKMRKILGKVYDYRSRALHGGIPFPAPMCEPPIRFDKTGIPAETASLGLATHTLGGSWMPEDLPINLHTFHYLTRKIILKWWSSMSEN